MRLWSPRRQREITTMHPKTAKAIVYVVLPLYIAGDIYRQIKGWNTRTDLILLLLVILAGLAVIAVANAKMRR